MRNSRLMPITNRSTAVDKMQGHNHNCITQTAVIGQKVNNALKWKAVDCLSDKSSKIIRWAFMEGSTLDVLDSNLIPVQIMESVFQNGHFSNLPFTEMDKLSGLPVLPPGALRCYKLEQL